MDERELFVFSGQSNMMGACVYPPSEQIIFRESFEYIHKTKRFPNGKGSFKNTAYPCGEFSYKNIQKAYIDSSVSNGKSTLTDYERTTYFCPSMSNLHSEKDKSVFPFSCFSEATAQSAPSLAPYVVEKWERLNRRCSYAHIAKGGVSINYYFNREMIAKLNEKIKKYNAEKGTDLPIQEVDQKSNGAGDYFIQKIRDFFADSEQRFLKENLGKRCFFWLQGESDAWQSKNLYKLYLEVLWDELKALGFTHFFCIRVGYWFDNRIVEIMKAQEEFCEETTDAYMLTRVCSYMPMPVQDLERWYGEENIKDFLDCRDSYFGFENHHINEKGFRIIATSVVDNMKRILIDGLSVQLDEEKCLLLG